MFLFTFLCFQMQILPKHANFAVAMNTHHRFPKMFCTFNSIRPTSLSCFLDTFIFHFFVFYFLQFFAVAHKSWRPSRCRQRKFATSFICAFSTYYHASDHRLPLCIPIVLLLLAAFPENEFFYLCAHERRMHSYGDRAPTPLSPQCNCTNARQDKFCRSQEVSAET